MAHPGKGTTPYILPTLWGIDVAVAAFFWSLCGAELMQVTMVSEGPILLLVAGVWVCAIVSRTRAAIRQRRGWCHEYYESHAVPMLLLAACVAAAGIWMLCYYVGKHVLPYAVVPALLLLLSLLPTRKTGTFKRFCRSIAFGFACLAPAFSMNFELTPVSMVFRAPCWYLGILFFLYQRERVKWEEEGNAPHRLSSLLVGGLFCLLLFCSMSAGNPNYFEHCMSITIAMGAACLMLLAKLRPHLNERGVFSLSWPIMTLPALLAILLFSQTH